jgi:hypothetical protein
LNTLSNYHVNIINFYSNIGGNDSTILTLLILNF